MDKKRGFISYSWSDADHQDWVTNLANRLVQDGVDIKYDKWDLKEGHDKYAFMESMVNSSDIDKVLIILDKNYCIKADNRKGGVGTETLIITPQLYENVQQEKFIPIVVDLDENGQPYLPAYLRGRIYVDLSNPEHFEVNYEKLLRVIYDRPSLTKPKLGIPPKYLFEDTPFHFKTTTLVRSFDSQIEKNPNRANTYLRDFLDEYYNNLHEFRLDTLDTSTMGQNALDKLTQYAPLRNDYIQFLDKLLRSEVRFDFDTILRFFERLPLLFGPPKSETDHEFRQSWRYRHFRLTTHELFLYTVSVALKNFRYDFLEELFHARYLVQEYEYNYKNEPQTFEALSFYYEDIDDFYRELRGKNYYNVHAELMATRVPDFYDRETFLKADLFCYYIAQLHDLRWFPLTYVYLGEYGYSFEFFNRLVSMRHFEKTKGVLGFDNVDDFKAKVITSLKIDSPGYNGGFRSRIPGLERFVNCERIGTEK